MSVPSPYADALARIPVAESSVEVLGSRTKYWTYGAADAPTTVVLVHGYRGEHHGLEPVVAHLPHLRFVAPDLPGFGESTELRDVAHDIEGYAAWLRDFIEALGLAEAVVLGHSFGSIVAASAVASGLNPPALVLVNPIAIPGSEGAGRVGAALTSGFYGVARLLPEQVARAYLSSPIIVRGMSITLAKTKKKPLRRWIHDQHRNYFSRFASKKSILEGFDASMSRSVSEFASGIDTPTLLIAAELDEITPLEAVRALNHTIPGSTLNVIGGVGHLIHYETPGEAASAIDEFVRATVSPS